MLKKLLYNSLFARIIDAVTLLASTAILARLVTPEEYGLLAICALFTVFFIPLTDFGISDRVIKDDRGSADKEKLNELYWFSLFVGLLVYFISVFLTFVLSEVLFNYDVTFLQLAYGIALPLYSVKVVQYGLMVKHFNFGVGLYYQIIGNLIGASAGVIAAYSGYGVWSLVIQAVLSQAVAATILMAYSPWKPNIRKVSIRNKITDFSLQLTGVKFLNILNRKFGSIFVASKLSLLDFGIYSRGYQLTASIVDILNGSIIRVAYPHFARYVNNSETLERSYSSILSVVTHFYIFSIVLVINYSELIVSVLLGDTWADVSALLPFFVTMTSLLGVCSISTHLLKASNNGYLLLKSFSRFVFLNALLSYFALQEVGLVGMLISMNIITFAYMWYLYYLIKKAVLPKFQYLNIMLSGIFLAGFLMLSIEALNLFLPLLELLSVIFVPVVAFFISVYYFKFVQRKHYDYIKLTIKNYEFN